MRILFITTAHNSLSQRLAVELSRRGHAITLSVGTSPDGMLRDVQRSQPDLIIAPMLKSAIPEQIYRRQLCLIVHPGIIGDRGPSSLDWAITLDEARWGVTVLQAEAEIDAGPIWATETFAMPFAQPPRAVCTEPRSPRPRSKLCCVRWLALRMGTLRLCHWTTLGRRSAASCVRRCAS